VLHRAAGVRGVRATRWPALRGRTQSALISWLCCCLSSRSICNPPPVPAKTYGYHRAGVLAALVNAVSLVAGCVLHLLRAFRRLQHPEHVQAFGDDVVAATGVVMNGVIALLLYRSGRRSGNDVNIRSALLHEVGDTLSTAASSLRLGDSGHR